MAEHGGSDHEPRSQITGPTMAQKRVRAELLSTQPNLFNANRKPEMIVNDISKSMGVVEIMKPTPMNKFNREKKG